MESPKSKLLFAVCLLTVILLSMSIFSAAQESVGAPPGVGGQSPADSGYGGLPGEGVGAPPGVGGQTPPDSGYGDGGSDGGYGGPTVVCVPAASCVTLGCGQTDSCGTFCGACPVPGPVPTPVPVPVPTPGPIFIAGVSVAPANPLHSIGLKFPLQSLFLRSVLFTDSDCVRPGESAFLAIKVRNTGTTTLKDVSFTATVPELGVYSRTGPVSITTTDRQTRFLRLDVPGDADEGIYYLGLTVTNTKFSRSTYRSFTVDSSCR